MRPVPALLTALALATVPVTSALAAPTPPAPLSAEEQGLVQRAAAYLQSLASVQGRFTQTTSRGGSSQGAFYLQRPGKARFEYDPGAVMLVVSDGYNVKVFDRKLKTFDQYPLGQTPLSVLLAREVRLDKGVVVTGVGRTPEGFSISARDARRQADGSITLNFASQNVSGQNVSGQPIALTGWTLVDTQGAETKVRLGPLTPARLDPKLFELKDPRARSGPR